MKNVCDALAQNISLHGNTLDPLTPLMQGSVLKFRVTLPSQAWAKISGVGKKYPKIKSIFVLRKSVKNLPSFILVSHDLCDLKEEILLIYF